MKLPDLKEEVRLTWESLEDDGSGGIPRPENFLPDMRKYGDLRKKKTWEKAFIQLYPAVFHRCAGLEAYWYITDFFNFTPGKPFYEYRHELFESFLQYPDGLDIIKLGLEQLHSHTAEQQERVKADGFFRLVQERVERGTGLPAEFVGSIPILAGEASR